MRLVEAEIADALSVSRTPVREALRLLEASGLVQYVRNRGFIVANILPDIEHVYLIRARLEGLAAWLAAREITVAELEAARSLQDEMERVLTQGPVDVAHLVDLNHRFHAIVVGSSRSPRLASLIKGLSPEYVSYQVVQSYDHAARVQSIREHRAILDALWRRDAEESDRLLQKHLERPKTLVMAEFAGRLRAAQDGREALVRWLYTAGIRNSAPPLEDQVERDGSAGPASEA
jgi:DNA-binding GntR family transcriptional regulator